MPAEHATGTLGITGSSELNRDLAGVQGTYGWSVQSGAVTFSSGLTFAVAAISAGDYTINSAAGAAFIGGNVVLATQDPSNPRVDIIVTTVAGAVSAVAGTPKALTTTSGPVPPTPSATQLEIARIFVPASGTALTSANITDRRHPLVTPFDGIRTQFRANRRLVAEWFAGMNKATAAMFGGLTAIGVDTSDLVTNISGEPVAKMSTVTAGTAGVFPTAFATGTMLAILSPNHSPRMLMRIQLPAASANVTRLEAGFFSADSLTADGAYLRIATTGNVFAVTRQGGSETAFDCGALSRTAVLGFEIETVDAGVTWVFRTQAGTVLTTSTTNVPTVSVVLIYGVTATTATGAVPWSPAYIRVEGTFA